MDNSTDGVKKTWRELVKVILEEESNVKSNQRYGFISSKNDLQLVKGGDKHLSRPAVLTLKPAKHSSLETTAATTMTTTTTSTQTTSDSTTDTEDSNPLLTTKGTSWNARLEIILKPAPEDVLLGRGKPYQSHPGNEAMRRLVDQNKARYGSLSREKKGTITNEILNFILNGGARFLKRPKNSNGKEALDDAIPPLPTKSFYYNVSGGAQQEETRGIEEAHGNNESKGASIVNQGVWVLASKTEAYEKICHALRARRKEKRYKIDRNNRMIHEGGAAAFGGSSDGAIDIMKREENVNNTGKNKNHYTDIVCHVELSASSLYLSSPQTFEMGSEDRQWREGKDLIPQKCALDESISSSSSSDTSTTTTMWTNQAIEMALKKYLSPSKKKPPL